MVAAVYVPPWVLLVGLAALLYGWIFLDGHRRRRARRRAREAARARRLFE